MKNQRVVEMGEQKEEKKQKSWVKILFQVQKFFTDETCFCLWFLFYSIFKINFDAVFKEI